MNATIKFDRPAATAETRKKRTTAKSTESGRLETLRRKQVRRDKYTTR